MAARPPIRTYSTPCRPSRRITPSGWKSAASATSRLGEEGGEVVPGATRSRDPLLRRARERGSYQGAVDALASSWRELQGHAGAGKQPIQGVDARRYLSTLDARYGGLRHTHPGGERTLTESGVSACISEHPAGVHGFATITQMLSRREVRALAARKGGLR